MCKAFLKPIKAKIILFLILFLLLPGIGVFSATSTLNEWGEVMNWENVELGITDSFGFQLIGTLGNSFFSRSLFYSTFGPPLILAGLAILQIVIAYLVASAIVFAFEKIKNKKTTAKQ